MAEKVFVSPGVYTSEKDLTFVTRQVGVTTLGLAGETTKGPAFQPIFISNYGEFQTFFGGLNNTLVNHPTDGNGSPLYELPYIAKSYLSQSNQLFVTRILGFSGYDAGKAWGITLDAALDPSTVTATTTSYDPIVEYTATTSDVITNLVINSPLLNYLYSQGDVSFNLLPTLSVGQTLPLSVSTEKVGLVFTGADSTIVVMAAGSTPSVLDPTTTGSTATNISYNPYISFTADASNNITNLVFGDQLTSDLYTAGSFSLASLPNLTVGQTGTIPVLFNQLNSSSYTGLNSVYTLVSNGLTPITLSAASVTLSGTNNTNPFITYTATTGGVLSTVSINEPTTSAGYANGNFSLSGLPLLSIGQFGSIARNYTNVIGNFTGNESTYIVIATGLTQSGVNTSTIVTNSTSPFNPIIDYTATTGNTLISVNIFDSLLNSLYQSGSFSLNSLPTIGTGVTQNISQSFIYNGSIFTGASASYSIVTTGITPYYFDPSSTGATTSISRNPFVTYTASTGGTLSAVTITDPLTNAFYNAGYFNLSSIPSLSVGSRGVIPFVMTGTGTVYTGASSNYIVVSKTIIPDGINPATTGATGGAVNANPLVTYTANVTTSAFTSININNTVLNAMYQANSSTIPSGLAGAAVGTTFSIPVSFVQSGSSYVGASAVLSAATSGLTPQTLNTNTISGSGPFYGGFGTPWFNFSADTTANTVTVSYINDYPYFQDFLSAGLLSFWQTSGPLSSTALNNLVGIVPFGNIKTLVSSFAASGDYGFSANTDTTYIGLYAYYTLPSTGATSLPHIYSGTVLGAFQVYNADANTRFLTGSTSGFTIQYSGSQTAAYMSGVLSGRTSFFSGSGINYETGTTLGNVTYFSANPLPIYRTGTTSGNTSVYLGTGIYYNTGTTSGVVNYYSGGSITLYKTGTTSGNTVYSVGYGYADVENKLVTLLRSRGRVNSQTQLPVFQVSATTGLNFDPASTGAEQNPLGTFNLIGTSNTLGAFNYDCSFDRTQRNYITNVLGRTPLDGETAVYVEEFYSDMFRDYVNAAKVRGINLDMIDYASQFSDYLKEYQPAVTPYVVSELRGNKVLRLFRFWTISDGNAANEQYKISITNIRPDTKEFDVVLRGFYDTDANPVVIEAFSRCTMDPTSNNFVARKIGTLDGIYASKSAHILLELDESSDSSDAFPAGFVGFPVRDYQINSNSSVQTPSIQYKQTYGAFENKRKYYLGLSDTMGIDSDFFDYKGVPTGQSYDMWTGLTKGFHMDINATGATIDNVNVVINPTGGTYNPIFLFDTGDWVFTTDEALVGGPYEKVFARKFTFAPYGGFDGWDAYRTRRTNLDNFTINGTRGAAGLNVGTFANRTLSNGDLGITSDYYAYLEGIWTFRNPEAVNINVFATPGIDTFDNTNLVEASIEMIEQDRADSLYVVTTPDTDSAGTVLTVGDVTDSLSDMFDSSYTATYWPWIQILDAENNVYIYVPPTRDVVRNIALTDNIAFPWFAVAGIQRGDVDAIKARKKLTLSERDGLYENRINPIATFTSDGIKIWGNKTLQVKESALDRINVRRLLLQARKLISAVAIRLLFEQNDTIVRNQFLALVNPILDGIRTERGLVDFRVVLSNDPEDIDRNQLTGKIYLKPTRALEFIIVEFNIMNTGASFDNI
jgi:hypothetical protein